MHFALIQSLPFVTFDHTSMEICHVYSSCTLKLRSTVTLFLTYKAYSKHCQISKMKRFAEILNG